MKRIVGDVDRLRVRFDDRSLVADGGVLLAATLMKRLGMESVFDRTVHLGGGGGARPGRKVLSLATSMLLGGSHIDHADRLRAGSTQGVLPFRVMAPSTLGTFLRSFTWGHVQQLNKALGYLLGRAWTQDGLGPGDRPLTLDVDSTICEVHGKHKQGARYGYTKQLGYHPLLAFRDDTAEIVNTRLRGGSSQRGNTHFVVETVRRTRKAGARGPVTIRADAGFWSYELIEQLNDLGVGWSISIPMYQQVRTAVERIRETEWETIDYTENGVAQVTDTLLLSKHRPPVRIVARRTRLTDPRQAQLWPHWRYHVFATSSNLDPVEADQYHRTHARCELAIRDLKQSGLEHLPSGQFPANAAWLAIAALSHNIHRWITHHSGTPPRRLVHASTIRRRLFQLPGRIVNHQRRLILRLPTNWPWATHYQTTLQSLRNLPQLC